MIRPPFIISSLPGPGSQVVFGPDHLAGLRDRIRYPAWVPAGAGTFGAFAGPGPGAGWGDGGRWQMVVGNVAEWHKALTNIE